MKREGRYERVEAVSISLRLVFALKQDVRVDGEPEVRVREAKSGDEWSMKGLQLTVNRLDSLHGFIVR